MKNSKWIAVAILVLALGVAGIRFRLESAAGRGGRRGQRNLRPLARHLDPDLGSSSG